MAKEDGVVRSRIAAGNRSCQAYSSGGEIANGDKRIWNPLFVRGVVYVLNLFEFLKSLLNHLNGGESLNAHVADVDLISTYPNAIDLELVLNRTEKTKDGIFGQISNNGKAICLTLENLALSIPAGLYPVSSYLSPHFGYRVPILQNVKDRSEIEIHKGNYPSDSRGCIIVATHHIGDTVEDSELAFTPISQLIFSALDSGASVRLKIVDSYAAQYLTAVPKP
jgi:hypothetical protein